MLSRSCRWSILASVTVLTAQTVDFNRDIRSILSDKCYTCHGPDQSKRSTKLRFDTEAGAKQDLGGRLAIIPGAPEKSEIVRRIETDDTARRMPPAYSGAAKLSAREIDLIRRWIAQGAQWQGHWSFIAPKRPSIPATWTGHPIDYFVRQKLEGENLAPSPEADRATLIRRVSLDLTGLPPTPAEVDAYLADASPSAYEKVVDRLLASPRYAERMTIRWLDAARYADTNGYQTDAERFMWRWRDWVIDAFNRNMPFDRFTVEQIAGDMLPNATLDQKIASGFNRNHRGNGEGGIIPEEYAVEYVVDRVDTTSTVWLGLTMGCARCHSHKYDPITQKEFYQFYAYFNNIPERGNAFKYGNSPPEVKAPTPEQQSKLSMLTERLDAAERTFREMKSDIAKAQKAWEKSAPSTQWSLADDLVVHHALDKEQRFDGKHFVDGKDAANFGYYAKFTLAAWIYPTSPTGAIVTRTEDTVEGQGFGLYLKDGKLQANLVQRWLDDGARVETERPVELNKWSHVAMTFDGSHFAAGVKIYIDGEPQKVKVHLDFLNQNFAVKEPLRIGAGGGPENRFHGAMEDVRVYGAALTAAQAAVLATAMTPAEIARIPAPKRTKGQADKLALCFLDQHAPASIKQAWQNLNRTRKEREQFHESIQTAMVMLEQSPPRDTHLLLRGAYDRPGEKVLPAVPAALPPLPAGAQNNRLGFARWLVDPANPLTARVAVNRFWQMYFGAGLVKTVEDFGSQGELPSHPGLLDWLATEFVRTGWDVKGLQKTIVMSATYRQSSNTSPELYRRDPENRLLARGPRFRLPAEAVRDQALAVSGLLAEKLGGPSVKPYQPAGLWKELAGGQDYQRDKGDNLYRRSLYTFWKRSVAPPSMMLFDSAGREACTVRETRTNTPLQALTLMNDVTFVEASRMMGERMMTEGGAKPEDRIAFAFRLATARPPRANESKLLLGGFHHYLDQYKTDRTAALKFLSEGERARNTTLDPSELAAYSAVASLILNLDETVTKE